MDKRQLIGLVLIFALFFIWSVNNSKVKQKLEREKFVQDSIAQQKQQEAVYDSLGKVETTVVEDTVVTAKQDSNIIAENQQIYGDFASNTVGEEEIYVLENDEISIKFSNKGGKIVDVWLKDYQKVIEDEEHNKEKVPLHLLDDDKNDFFYILPAKGVAGGEITTKDLYFNAEKRGNSIIFSSNNGAISQQYTLNEEYDLSYELEFDEKQYSSQEPVKLIWNNYLDKLELNDYYERFYSTVYFKELEESSDYCNCRKDDTEEVDQGQLKWVSHSNQFFNSSLISNDLPFSYGKFETVGLDEDAEDLKLIRSELHIPAEAVESGNYKMSMYLGPNEFKTLQAYDIELEHIIPFGRSLFGTINRWVIRPFFNFLDNIVNSKGLAIILLILIVKMGLYPLTYRMLKSQALMGALKPEIKSLKDKHKDDSQAQQVETMKLYREYGVSPLGGCFPMILQMPIWYALFRFFPASINFRQEPFLWADDLSSYDALFYLPFEIPMLGEHLSLFTLLWVISQLVYTFYNTQHMDMSANPAMKYVQYFMPVMFLVFFNQYASGLTVYMFFSNLITIAQTVITKQFIFKEEKLREQLIDKKNKPKKKSKFQSRLEDAMKEQQKIKDQQNKKKKK